MPSMAHWSLRSSFGPKWTGWLSATATTWSTTTTKTTITTAAAAAAYITTTTNNATEIL